MLIPGFYTNVSFDNTDGKITSKLVVNTTHEVYNGHFPGRPVMPGVMQLDMIKECLELAVDKHLLFGSMTYAKFLNLIIPGESDDLTVRIEYKTEGDKISFSASIVNEEKTFSKVKGVMTYSPEE